MRSLPLRARILAALAVVAVVPLALFGLIVLFQASLALGQRQADDLAALTRLAARQTVSVGVNPAAAAPLAELTARRVTLFRLDGTVVATSDPDRRAAPPPENLRAGDPPRVVSGGGSVAAYQVVADGTRSLGIVALAEDAPTAPQVIPGLAGALAAAIILGAFLSFALARSLVRPARELTATLERLHAGDLAVRMPVEGDDELARLAESHNRLADALTARNRSLGLVLHAVAQLSPRDGLGPLVEAAQRAAMEAFGFTGARVVLDPSGDGLGEPPEKVPGEAYEVRVPLTLGSERIGTLVATQVPTRDWSAADADLAALFGSQLAVAVRNAELFAAVESLSELKSDFLRGVSHNLQTPLTSIRAFADQLAAETDDRRLDIIVEQTDRLSRLVAQLLTVAKLEAGTLRPEVDVFPIGPLLQRVWESLGRTDHAFRLRDETAGWLAAADRDWVEQVAWALLDNALKYGGDGAIEVSVRLEDGSGEPVARLVTTVRDHGAGIPPGAEERVFERFSRLGRGGGDGTGLGLNVARGLVEGMGGRLWFERPAGPGAAFSFSLPAERIEEA
ncbi:MAG TPA: ATP-binding protein [Candidatus Limnocylindrales bacterium]|nr:ATP-binding protein [Candidatus Limnocylindrales bacterium]